MSNDPNLLTLLQHQLVRWDGRCKPFPEAYTVVEYERIFPAVEVRRLLFGLIPADMDDKWLGVLRPEGLDFHRSWTGIHLFRLPVSVVIPGGLPPPFSPLRAGPILVNEDPREAPPFLAAGSSRPVQIVEMLIERMLRPLQLPSSV